MFEDVGDDVNFVQHYPTSYNIVNMVAKRLQHGEFNDDGGCFIHLTGSEKEK